MGYTAVHADWGRLDASRGDLGCGRAWADVHRVKGLVLTCPECRGRVFARVSHYSVRHFYHQVRPENCELANESPEHHLLKLELAMAARAAGWRAELEVSNEARTWRADAMVFDEHGRPFMALEAQLSPLTPDEARMRTDRYAQDGVAVCWVALEDRPWERIVPSLRVRLPRLRGESWTVWHGMARYTWAPRTLKAKAKWVHITCTLGEAVQWILEKRVHAFTGPNGTVRWTTPPYEQLAIVRARMEAEAETAKRAADAQQRRKETEQRAEERRRLAQQRARERKAEVQRLKPFFEQTGLDAMAWQVFTQMVRSASGKAIQYGTPGPRLRRRAARLRPTEVGERRVPAVRCGLSQSRSARRMAQGPDDPGAQPDLALTHPGRRPHTAEGSGAGPGHRPQQLRTRHPAPSLHAPVRHIGRSG
ncbi:competence protein CoiA family protein [Streptomyces agglomeratus]|uniref:competence protein CoiA family protein n=1 Tax=Streptomyces agglomeratus TaxID=285458 RepID=UPI000A7456DE|nr:competence protein CoiA family protein [Streptomyces agglomeratus]